MKVDKEEIDKIMEEVEQSLATTRDAEREHWSLFPDEQAQLAYHARAVDPPNEAMLKVEGIKAKGDPWALFPVAFYTQAEYLG